MLVAERRSYIQKPQPQTFVGLMELYEVNYIRLRQMCPGLEHISTYGVSIVEGATDLYLRIEERTTYTTTVRLTYYWQDARQEPHPEPNVLVRIYHDARQAEVLSRTCRRLGGEVKVSEPMAGSELACRWKLNRFLYKWLGYCQHQGHCFLPTGIGYPA